MAGLLLVAVAVGVTAITDGGGGPVATPTDTALPSRPPAGPDPGDGAPDEEEDLAIPEDDVPTDPADEPEDEPDQRKSPKPRRHAPTRKAPSSGDTSTNAPREKPANQTASKPVDVPKDDWDEVERDVPFEPPETPNEQDVVVFATEAADANTLATTVPAKDDGFATRDRWRQFRPWYGDATPVAGDRTPTTMATPHRYGRPSHRMGGSRWPIVKGDDRHDCPAKVRGVWTRSFDRHGARDADDRYPSMRPTHLPRHLVGHAAPSGDHFVHLPSTVDPQDDSHYEGPVTYLGP